jgi:CelD/BcsL family acetyltransferase involved in cellulose biosynthesis
MTVQTNFWSVEAGMSDQAALRLIEPKLLTDADRAAWDDLATQAEAGAFFSHRWFLEPLLDAPGRRLAVVEDRGRWTGVMGIEPTNRLGRLPAPMWRGVKDANQFLGLPLVRRGMSAAFWRALVIGLERHRSTAIGLYLPVLPEDGPVTAGLRRWCVDDGRRLDLLRSHERAALTGGQCFNAVSKQMMSADRRRRLASLARKLESDVGSIRVEAVAGAESTAAWIEQFLALEWSGWKGEAQSAMAAAASTERLFRSAVMGATSQGVAQCLTLYAGDVPLAASVQFVDGQAGCGFKTSFDERHARYAPGIQLLLHITKLIGETPGLRFDSCSTPDQMSINALWPERRRINDYCVGLRGEGRGALFDALMMARRAWAMRRGKFGL